MARGWKDDTAALHVVEALLAGMIILTAVLFLTNVSKPSPPAAESGLDLEGVARDILVVLQNRPAGNDCDAPSGPGPCHPSRLSEIVSRALGHDVADAAARDQSNSAGEAFLDQVIPVGNRWLLRLDNGVEPLVVLPDQGSNVRLTPRAAKAAEVFIAPQWQALTGPDPAGCGAPPSDPLTPGGPEGAMDVQAGDLLEAPTGAVPPSGASSWAEWWRDQQQRFVARDTLLNQLDPGLGLVPELHLEQVPPTAMYGWWRWDNPSDADPPTCHFVGLPDGTATEYAVYGIQLVVWPIAG